MSVTTLQKELATVNDSTIKHYYNFSYGIMPALIMGKKFNNGLDSIQCVDKKGEVFNLVVNDHTELKITCKNGYKKIFLLDTMFAKDSLFYGRDDHIFNAPTSLPIREIEKIEVTSR